MKIVIFILLLFLLSSTAIAQDRANAELRASISVTVRVLPEPDFTTEQGEPLYDLGDGLYNDKGWLYLGNGLFLVGIEAE